MTEELKPCPAAYGLQNTAITGSNRWMLLREHIPANDQYNGALWTPLYTRAESAEVEQLREENKRLRHIMTHIDGKIVMQARSAAGYAMHIHTLQNAAPLPKWPEEP